MIAAHDLAGEQTPDDAERLLERRRPLLDVGAHGQELRLVVAQAGLHDEAAARDGGERADLLGDQHRVPQRKQEQAPGGLVAPLRQQTAHDRDVLVVRPRCRVVIADEERIEPGTLRGGRALDQEARGLARVANLVGAGQRDADAHHAGRKRWLPFSRTM